MLEVLRIEPYETYEWIKRKHYAKRMPPISYAFGLYAQRFCIGIVTYGNNGGNSGLNEIAGYKGIELNRLCINDDAPKNSASILVGRSLQMLPYPMVVVSYADCGQGHIGYIYQATNWLYTGLSSGDTEYEKDGKIYHRKSLFDVFGTGAKSVLIAEGYNPVVAEAKHRYLFFVGDKRDKKRMRKNLTWPILPYPKGDTRRYDASHQANVQGRLF